MKSIRVLLAALILQVPALSFAFEIVATFEGSIGSSIQQLDGSTTVLSIPFLSTISIFTDDSMFEEDPDQHTSATSFGGSSFSTEITNTLLNTRSPSDSPSIESSHRVYRSASQPADARSQLESTVSWSVNDQNLNEFWFYGFTIGGDIGSLADDEHGPVSGQALFDGLTFAMNEAQSFDLTGFFTAVSLEEGGALTAVDLYVGSARLTSVSSVAAVPEPSTYALMLLGLAASGFAVRRRQVAEF
jgi:hypothetical protein